MCGYEGEGGGQREQPCQVKGLNMQQASPAGILVQQQRWQHTLSLMVPLLLPRAPASSLAMAPWVLQRSKLLLLWYIQTLPSPWRFRRAVSASRLLLRCLSVEIIWIQQQAQTGKQEEIQAADHPTMQQWFIWV